MYSLRLPISSYAVSPARRYVKRNDFTENLHNELRMF